MASTAVLELIVSLRDEASGGLNALKGSVADLGNFAGTGFSGLQSLIGGGLAVGAGLAAGAVGGLAYAFRDAADLARVQRNAEKELNAVLEATQFAAGLTADELKAMASGLQNVTNYGDEVILQGQSMLLTFKNIGADVFPRATEAMLDWSQKMGTDPAAAAVTLGKALNDPIQGISALSRVGVQFTDDQKAMMAAMVEAGDIAGAQGVILAEIEGQFGGVARAMADPAIQAQNAWGDFKEMVGAVQLTFQGAVGEAMLPLISRLQESFADWLPIIQDVAERIAGHLVVGIERLMGAIDGIIPIVMEFATQLGYFFAAMAEGVPLAANFADMVYQLAFNAFGMAEEEAIALADSVEALINQGQAFVTQVQEFIAPIAATVAQFVSWQDVLGAVGIVIASIVIPALFSIVAAALPVIAVGAALIGAVALLRNAWEGNWGGIQEKTAAVVAWLRTNIPAALQFIQNWWATHGGTIIATVQNLWSAARNAFDSALAWIRNLVSTALSSIQSFWATHGETILGTARRLWDTIRSIFDTALAGITLLWRAFQSAREGDWRGFGEQLRVIWDRLWEAMRLGLVAAWELIKTALRNGLEAAKNIFTSIDWGAVGRGIVEGIAAGIRNGASLIGDAARGAAQNALDAAKGFLGIRSPSRVMAQQIGLPMAQGVAQGITSNLGLVDDAMRRLQARSLDGLSTSLAVGVGAGSGMAAGAAPIYVTINAGPINSEIDVEAMAYRVAAEISKRR